MRDDPLSETPVETAVVVDRPLPTTNDPGGAAAKGYSAEAGEAPAVAGDGPLPLAAVPEPPPAIVVRERDPAVHPTGRSEPGDYTSNDRLMGADR